ncbi:MAG: hypothetical protein AAF799_36190 [Myxococcota bacterium]
MTQSIDPLELFKTPARLGKLGAQARERMFGEEVWIRPAPSHPAPAVAALIRDDEVVDLQAWPEANALRPGDRLVVQAEGTAEGRRRFVAWLRALAADCPRDIAVAPTSPAPSGMQRLWCIAAARVLLPAHVRVEARHDLVGIRLAQLAVGCGADTLAGPVEPDRKLPLAGVTRPNEATQAGLATLVRQVGLTPHAA